MEGFEKYQIEETKKIAFLEKCCRIDIEFGQATKSLVYLTAIKKYTEQVNLISSKAKEHLEDRHFLDCLLAVPIIRRIMAAKDKGEDRANIRGSKKRQIVSKGIANGVDEKSNKEGADCFEGLTEGVSKPNNDLLAKTALGDNFSNGYKTSMGGQDTSRKHIKILDVGSGAGFPAVVLALALDGVQVLAVESKGKKARFLEMIKDELSLENLQIYVGDIKSLGKKDAFDIITARAYGAIEKIVFEAHRYLKGNGCFLLYKGKIKKTMEELEACYSTAEKRKRMTRWQLKKSHAKIIRINHPFLEEDRCLVRMYKGLSPL